MQRGIQRLWKRWAVPYQEPAVLDETIFLPNNMVMRLRCLVVIVFSWEHGPMYKCWLYATVVHVHEGLLRLLTGRSSHCCLGGSSYWGEIFWCISTSLLFVLGQTVLVECFGFLPAKMRVLAGGLWGSTTVPTLLTRQVHDCTAWSVQHKESFLRSPVSPSQWKQSFVSHWAVMNHKSRS